MCSSDLLRRNVCPRVMVGYGSSEAGIVAAGPAETLNLDKGEIGKVIPGVEVEIVDETSGKPVKSGSGLVRIRGAGVARGYYDEAAAQSSHFKDGWFYPGDIGSVSSGVLSIAGRKDHVVSFGGVKTTLETVEAQLMHAPAVKEIAVVPVSGATEVKKVQAFIVPAEGWSEKAFWDYCHAKVENTFWPVKIAVLASLPRVASGKVDRQRLIASA